MPPPPSHRDFMAWKLGKREALAHHEVSMLLAERPPAHIKFPGSWEEAAVHINLDALYQRGVFEVAHAVAVAGPGWMMPNTAHRDQKIEYFLALRGGFAALERVRTLLDDEGQSSALSVKDLRKNYALCASRLAFAFATLDHSIVTSKSPGHSGKDVAEHESGDSVFSGEAMDKVAAARAALDGIQAFQRDDPADGAQAAFQQVVPLLEGIAGASGLSVGTQTKAAAKKTMKNKKKRKEKLKEKKKTKKKKKKKKKTN